MASPAPARGKRKNTMRSPVTWVIVLGVALAGGAYLMIRRSRASAAAAGTTTATSATPAGTTAPDWSGEIATLQEEIMNLQSTEAQDEKEEDKDEDEDDEKKKKRKRGKTGTPTHVHSTAVTDHSIGVAWNHASNATGYDARIAGRGTEKSARKNHVETKRVHGTSVTFSGLRPHTPYAINVVALPGGGTGTIEVTTREAPRKPVWQPSPKPPRYGRPRTAAHHVTRRAA